MQFAKISSFGLAGLLVGLGLQDWGGRPSAALASPTPAAAAYSATSESARRGPIAPASASAAATASTQDPLPALPRIPDAWLPSRGRECIRAGRYRGVCQGPRRVPLPSGPEARLAAELGLGNVRALGRLIFKPPKHEWTQAAGDPRSESLLWPIDQGRLVRGLRPARDGQRGHKGLDISAPEGTPFRAIKSGIVAYSDNAVPGYGNLLAVIHPDGSVAFYGHCRAIYVFAGQRVARGQIVGEVGRTGRADGPHVHFEYRVAGRVRNSLPLFGKQPRRWRS